MAIVRTGAGVRLPRLDGGEEGSPEATEDEEEESRATPSQESGADGFSGGEEEEEEENGGGGEEPEELEEELGDDELLLEEEEEGDSGMGSDELEVTELGEPGAEMCQVGHQSFAVPLELYDLAGLRDVLSLDAWNTLLSEDERVRLAALLPDMDQETFARTLVELLAGQSFHFGSPLAALFEQLKGGLCDPRINLYRRGKRFAERRKHYYWLQSYHNSMVRGLWEIKDCWKGSEGYSLDERLRMLDTLKAQKQRQQQQQQRKALASVRRAGSETDSESREAGDQVLNQLKLDKIRQKKAGKLVKERSKGLLRVGMPKGVDEEYAGGAGRDAAVAPSELSHQDNAYGYDLGMHRGKHHRSIDGLYSEEPGYERDLSRTRLARLLPKPVKKKELAMSYDGNLYGNNYRDNNTASPYYYGKNPSTNQGVTLAAYDPPYFDTRRNARYSEGDWVQGGKGVQSKAQTGDEMHWTAGTHTGHLDDWQKGQSAGDYRSRKDQAGYGPKVKSYKSIEQQVIGARIGSNPTSKISQVKMAGKSSSQFDRIGQKHSRGNAVYSQSEETESDSSEQFEDGGGVHFLERKPDHHHSGFHRPAHGGAKKSKKLAKVVKMNYPTADADLEPSRSKGFKGKVSETGYLRDVDVKMVEQISDVTKPPAASGERKRKVVANLETHVNDNSELHEINEDANDSLRLTEGERLASRSGHAVQDSDVDFGGTERVSGSSATKKTKGRVEVPSLDEPSEHVPSGPKIVDSISASKKKSKKKPESTTDAVIVAEPAADVPENNAVTVEPEKPEKIEKPKKKYVPISPTIHTGFSFSVVHLLTAVKKAMVSPAEDTAVKKAMVSPAEDTPAAVKQPDGEENKKWFNNEEHSKTPQEQSTAEQAQQVLEGTDASAAEQTAPSNSPALTVQEIVNRIKSNPGDPRILETQEPLQDLVRGVLKVLSSRTAPLGAKGWKALVAYEKSNKSWFWVGPVPSISSYDDADEETSAEAWSIPHKMLVKLVDAFSNWLKSGQETLKQIGSLPPPPPPNPANLDLKERFKELRAQKSLNTISPSSDEARAYFQREEFLRYSIPDRAFCYTAADGEKSIVAPLRRGGGKPTAKARGHPMLLPDRPPHVTILCLVRDAASRLPARTGTRADVCTLLRDSQYLNHEEANKEAAINQVVSGALDRLHYERDPCVLYDNDKKLWTYLHRGREEEDFEDDGTSSTKKWKRPRKDPSDPAEPGAANDDFDDDGTGTPSANNAKKQKADHGDPTVSGEANDEGDHATQNPSSGGLEGDPDLNAVPSSKNYEESGGVVYIDAGPDDGGSNSVDAKPGSRPDDNPASWQSFPEHNKNNTALPENTSMDATLP
ncbi:Nuclear factor related to kappa-B-binding protein [Dichanthelium oligosanthes]|uniref:Nuclear factor related to kappa-B-binding protein n=1 Tax=Dichanthelium oligosanthes TaxID=888268 RepID=A0A1E5V236_9POAL|nr:Nuclear factor related to kappa-B-binding protein [Dichanthelium oligosanthes]